MSKLVLLRHGESIWNLENKFTGWIDVDLSMNGIKEAEYAGTLFKENGYNFDMAFTSLLKRAQKTLDLSLSRMDLNKIKIFKDWRLNERHYGSLQGLNKNEMVKKFGQKQVFKWRRSYDIPPPKLNQNDITHPRNDTKYSNIEYSNLPSSESLKDVIERLLPLWNNNIINELKLGKKILIVAHGNSLRAIYKILKNINQNEIINFNIPTGIPLIFEFDEKLNPKKDYYLGDQEIVNKKIQAVINQTSTKSQNK